MKMNFGNFEIQKRIPQAVRAQRVDENNGVICLIFFFPLSYGPQIAEKSVFLANL